MLTKFTNLAEFQKSFSTELKCIKYLIALRWNNQPQCPRCNKQGKGIYTLKKSGMFKCKDCNRQFSVRINTIFEDSPIPFTKWFLAFYLEISQPKGISSHQLAKHLGLRQETAWFMLQRIRWALANNTIEKLKGDVEVDETYVGGKETNKHKDKKRLYTQGGNFKMVVVDAIQRGGKLAMQYIRKSNIGNIKPFFEQHIDLENTNLHTDESPLYKGYARNVVNHSKGQYGFGSITTNRIEGVFSHFKRMVLGVYHQITHRHIDKYINSFTFRMNNRNLNIAARFELAMNTMFGKKWTYAELTS